MHPALPLHYVRRLPAWWSGQRLTQPQRYVVTYKALVRNHESRPQTIQLILPIVPTTDYQALEQPVVFDALKHHTIAWHIMHEERYGNDYAVARIVLPPQADYIYSYTATIIIQSRKVTVDQKYTLTDYSAVQVPGVMLASNQYIQSNLPDIKKKAQVVTHGLTSLNDIIMALNAYVIKQLRYGRPIDGLYTTQEALTQTTVDCGGFSVLLAALCMSIGIPARFISGFWAGYEHNTMHAWLEIMLPDGQWLPLDPSVEYLAQRGRTGKVGRLGFIGSDRLVTSLGCDIPIVVNNQQMRVPILQHPVVVIEEGEGTVTARAVTQTRRV